MLTMVLIAVLLFIVLPTVVAAFTIEPAEPVCPTCGDTAEWCDELRKAQRRHPSNG